MSVEIPHAIASLRLLVETLSDYDSSTPVFFENGGTVGSIVSWRGSYEQATIDSGSAQTTTVGELVKEAQALIDGNQILYGYKGGEFKATENTALWADEYGECPGNIISHITYGHDDSGHRLVLHRLQIGGGYI